ncbi:MAG: hypothetical protein AAF502_22430 [Bacteroidota bacterium]
MTKTSDTDQYLEKVIRRLEVEGNDLYALFTEVEADCFTTEDLVTIQSKLKKRKNDFRFFHRRVLFLIALCPAFFILSYLFSLIGWSILSLTSFGIAPLLFLLFLGGTLYLNRRYGTRSDIDFLIEKASREIRHRERLGIH